MAKAVLECTLGKHPESGCACGAYRATQCCEEKPYPFEAYTYGPCKLHKCSVRNGCKCPLPEGRKR